MRAKNCLNLRSVHSAPICHMNGTAKQVKGLLEVISTNVVDTQAGENEGMQQNEDKMLVRGRENKETDGVMNCKGKNSWLTKGSR